MALNGNVEFVWPGPNPLSCQRVREVLDPPGSQGENLSEILDST